MPSTVKYYSRLKPRVTWELWFGVIASDQSVKSYAKASRVLGMIRRNICYNCWEVMLRLYKSMVRPHIEYCTVAWSSHYIKEKQLTEKIQRRFIKMIPGFRDKSYEEGLWILHLNTLEERRNRADLIFLFKMYKELSWPPYESLFQLTKTTLQILFGI